jgi:predicted membrane metal-binding protein
MVDMNGASFFLTWAIDSVMLAAAGGVILSTRCLPRWLGWWALVTAPLLLATVPFATSAPPTFLLALIWIVATSITLVVRGDRTPATTPAGIAVTA